MHVFLEKNGKHPSLIVRHNLQPIEYGRCVVVQARDDSGVKSVQCWKDESGQAAAIVFTLPEEDYDDLRRGAGPNIGPRKVLDAIIPKQVALLEKMQPTHPADIEMIGQCILDALTNDANEWPGGFSDLIRECAS
jgi:hypothetical protein